MERRKLKGNGLRSESFGCVSGKGGPTHNIQPIFRQAMLFPEGYAYRSYGAFQASPIASGGLGKGMFNSS